MNLNRHFIACNASSAWSFDFCHRLVASITASSHTLVIPRLVAKSQGDCPVVFVNSLISFALNRFAFVDMLAPLGVIACTPDFKSRVIDFPTHSSPPRYPACPYFSTLDNTGLAIAHTVPPTAAPVAMSHIVASLHSFIIGFVAPNQAPTTPDRRASCHIHLAPARYPPPIGETARATSGAYVPALNAVLSNSGDCVTCSIAFTSSQNHIVPPVIKSSVFPLYLASVSRLPAANARVLYAHFWSKFHSSYFLLN